MIARSKLFRLLTKPGVLPAKTVLKYGAVGVAAGATGAALSGLLTSPEGFKKQTSRTNAKIGGGLAAAAVVGILGRKHIARAVAYGAGTGLRSVKKDLSVIFRKINGRVIPIKVKR